MEAVKPPQEEARVKSLRALNILDLKLDPQLDALTELTALQLGFPYAVVNLIETEVQWTKSAFGFATGPLMARSESFCAHTILDPEHPTVVPDARRDQRFADLRVVIDDPKIRAYAGVALKDAENRALGTLCVFDTQPRPFSLAVIDTLTLFARIASSRLEHHRLEAVLRESEDHYRHLVELNPQFPWVASPTGETTEVSDRWLKLTGIAADRAVDPPWAEAVHPEDRQVTSRLWAASVRNGEPFDAEYRLRLADGRYRWFRGRGSARRNGAGEVIRWYGTDEDIDDRKMTQLALQESETRLSFALEAGRLGTWKLDLATWRASLSRLTAHDLGLPESPQEIDQPTWLSIIHPDDRSLVIDTIEDAARSGETRELQYRAVWPDGSIHWIRATGRAVRDAQGAPLHILGLSMNITRQRQMEDERAQANEHLRHLAHHDPLTGLANRRLFHETLNRPETWDSGTRLALLFLDLDNFKRVNDSLGHEAGDLLLVEAARRIKMSTDDRDLVARLGGDEFAVLQTGILRGADAEALARRILQCLAQPFAIGGKPVPIAASIGVSLAPDHTTVAIQLMRNADAALYEAKAAGRGHFCLYRTTGAGSGIIHRHVPA